MSSRKYSARLRLEFRAGVPRRWNGNATQPGKQQVGCAKAFSFSTSKVLDFKSESRRLSPRDTTDMHKSILLPIHCHPALPPPLLMNRCTASMMHAVTSQRPKRPSSSPLITVIGTLLFGHMYVLGLVVAQWMVANVILQKPCGLWFSPPS